MSDDAKVHQALLKARAEFGPVLRNQTNPHFKNKYADLSAVLDAVEESLSRHGLVLVQRPDLVEGLGLVLVTELIEVESGQRIVSRYPLSPGKQNDPQALGGALTYARRYCALAMLGLAPEDDDGEKAAGRGQQQRQQKPAQRQRKPSDDDEVTGARMALEACETVPQLVTAWTKTPKHLQKVLAAVKDEMKAKLTKSTGGGAK